MTRVERREETRRRLLDAAEDVFGPVPSPDDLALAHSALAAGLAVRLLIDPEAITPERAARLMQALFVERDPP